MTVLRLPLGPLPADLHLPAGSTVSVEGSDLVILPAPARWSPTQRLVAAMHTEHARRVASTLPPAEPSRPARQPL